MSSWYERNEAWEDDRWFQSFRDRDHDIADDLDRAAERLWDRLHRDTGESGQPIKPAEKKRAA